MANLAVQQPAPLATTGETASTVLAAQAKALVSARFEIAIRQPRDLEAVRQRLLRECQRPSFAYVAIYRKPIGKGVEGPSIRFAEAAIQAMGNLAIDTPTVYDDGEKRIMRVSVSDMETNVTHTKDVTIMKRVERNHLTEGQVPLKTRTNSRGGTVYIVEATDDEILNQENALVSKALRTTGLRLVPGWLVDECMTAVRATRQKDDAVDPDAARRRLFDAFGELGVSVDALKQWLGHDAAPQPKELEELRGIYTAIKDGDTTWREVLDARWAQTIDQMGARATGTAPATRTAAVKEKLAAKAAKPAAAPTVKPQEATPSPPRDSVPGWDGEDAREPGSDDGAPEPTPPEGQ